MPSLPIRVLRRGAAAEHRPTAYEESDA